MTLPKRGVALAGSIRRRYNVRLVVSDRRAAVSAPVLQCSSIAVKPSLAIFDIRAL